MRGISAEKPSGHLGARLRCVKLRSWVFRRFLRAVGWWECVARRGSGSVPSYQAPSPSEGKQQIEGILSVGSGLSKCANWMKELGYSVQPRRSGSLAEVETRWLIDIMMDQAATDFTQLLSHVRRKWGDVTVSGAARHAEVCSPRTITTHLHPLAS